LLEYLLNEIKSLQSIRIKFQLFEFMS